MRRTGCCGMYSARRRGVFQMPTTMAPPTLPASISRVSARWIAPIHAAIGGGRVEQVLPVVHVDDGVAHGARRVAGRQPNVHIAHRRLHHGKVAMALKDAGAVGKWNSMQAPYPTSRRSAAPG